jgi:hypothetical protein
MSSTVTRQVFFLSKTAKNWLGVAINSINAALSRDIKIPEIRLCKDQANAFDNFNILRVDEATVSPIR